MAKKVLTTRQLRVLEELMDNPNVKFKKSLKQVIWGNTNPPKFKVGQYFIVSDPGHRVFGNPVKDFKAKIVKINGFYGQLYWGYELEAEVICEGKVHIATIHCREHDLEIAKRCRSNTNVLKKMKSKYEESMDV